MSVAITSAHKHPIFDIVRDSLATHDYNAAPKTEPEGAAIVMTIPDECAGLRLDQALARMLPAHSRRRIRAWIDAGAVTIAGNVGHAKQRVA